MPSTNQILRQVRDYLRAVAGIESVHSVRLKFVDAPATPVAFVGLGSQVENRLGVGGFRGAGKKWVHHNLRIVIQSASTDPEDPSTGEESFRDLVDAVRAALRPQQALACLAVRFGEDITVRWSDPEDDGASTHYLATVETEALEEITA